MGRSGLAPDEPPGIAFRATSYSVDILCQWRIHAGMSGPLHTVVETPSYLVDAARIGMTEAERRAAVDELAADPSCGDEVRGSGGIRKVRVAGRGKGKSGGYRVMVAFVGGDAPVYLLAVLSKGDRENFTAAEIARMKALTTQIKQARKGAKER